MANFTCAAENSGAHLVRPPLLLTGKLREGHVHFVPCSVQDNRVKPTGKDSLRGVFSFSLVSFV